MENVETLDLTNHILFAKKASLCYSVKISTQSFVLWKEIFLLGEVLCNCYYIKIYTCWEFSDLCLDVSLLDLNQVKLSIRFVPLEIDYNFYSVISSHLLYTLI